MVSFENIKSTDKKNATEQNKPYWNDFLFQILYNEFSPANASKATPNTNEATHFRFQRIPNFREFWF